ncbi:MAG: ExeM/NucH family extracellular endonuclease [Chloroflexi bacterium]|nr:ExeM/NucH family extracellular endonuclease [Chloroflexota bacterium]
MTLSKRRASRVSYNPKVRWISPRLVSFQEAQSMYHILFTRRTMAVLVALTILLMAIALTGAPAVQAVALDVCTSSYTPIYQIQGNGLVAAITGAVTTQGVVVGDYEGASPTLRGFYLQDAAGDGDAATSDGIFVFNGNNNTVNLGDVVRVTGNASEFHEQTQISASSIINCGTGSVAPVDVTFPVPSATFLEQYEGMLVRLPQTLYVTEHFQLGRFGQIVMSAEARLPQPTHLVAPGAPAQQLQAQNNLNRIIVDDALQNQNPDPILFGRGGNPLSASNTLRGGDTATGIVGVMTFTWAGNAASGNAFRVRPLNALGASIPDFQPANPRPTTPQPVGGTVQVVSMNLLNFFNTFDGLPDTVDNCTFGVGGAPADCRGADTQAEFDRQWPKTVAAILAIDPDVLAVNEIENDGYGPASAIQFLTDQLNAATAPGAYAFIDVDANTGQVNALGTDAIKVGMLYKPARVTPIGRTGALNSVAFVNGGDSAPRSRPSLAQAFETTTGARFVVDANHLKSKGSACDAPDAGDGQGNCNQVRINAAIELANWLATDPTGIDDTDVLIIGDLNSYAREDPITTLKNASYTNLIQEHIGAEAYSFVFDGQWGYLDHALASQSVSGQVTGVTEYHIDADEPSVLDYNTNFKTPNLQATLYAPDQYRVSDHDPLIVGLELRAFDFDGFLRPIDNLPDLNEVKAGRAIPIKFTLGGDFGLDIFSAGYPQSVQIDCETAAVIGNPEETVAAGKSGLSFSPGNQRYKYGWKTKKAWEGTCRQFIVNFVDGSVERANFKFK